MDSKRITWLFMFIGGMVGGYVPLIWGASFLSFSSVLFSGIGGFLGIWIAYKFTH